MKKLIISLVLLFASVFCFAGTLHVLNEKGDEIMTIFDCSQEYIHESGKVTFVTADGKVISLAPNMLWWYERDRKERDDYYVYHK